MMPQHDNPPEPAEPAEFTQIGCADSLTNQTHCFVGSTQSLSDKHAKMHDHEMNYIAWGLCTDPLDNC